MPEREASIIITREDAKVQVTLGEALDQYRAELESLGRAENTIHRYFVYLRKFARSAGEHLTVRAAVTPEKMTVYFQTITTTHTRNAALAGLRGFLTWAVRMRYVSAEASAAALGSRQTKTVDRAPKHYIGVDEFPALLDAGSAEHPIERAVLALSLYTLCRQSEIIGLRLADVNLPGRELAVYRPKRSRHTTVTISPDLADELMVWLDWYAKETGLPNGNSLLTHRPDWPLIPNWGYQSSRVNGTFAPAKGEPTIDPARSPLRLEYVIKRALTKLGAKTKNGYAVKHLGEGVHTVRRSGARALLDHLEGAVGADRALLMVSAMLDHDDPKMTLRYIGLHIDKQRLDAYLKTNSMYGPPKVTPGASVIPMRRAI